MKRILLVLMGFLLACSVQATDIKAGKQYFVVNSEKSLQPEVIEFFSFYCPHCYFFEAEYKIPQKVKENLPAGTTFKQYHVSFLGPQSEQLTRAWALAMALGVEDKVRMPLFDITQAAAKRGDRNSPTAAEIRQIFLDNGVSAEQYDGGIQSFVVNGLVKKQQQLAEKFNVNGVPDFYINGKYRVNMEGLSHNEQSFVQEYVDTVKALLQL